MEKALNHVHFLPTHFHARLGCGIAVSDLVNRREDWDRFNKLRSTTWREIDCPECLEHLYQKKKAELAAIGAKLGKGWT